MLFTMGRGDFDHKNIIISTDHIKEACRLIDEYFVPHALAVRDLIGEGAAKDTNLIVKIESVLRVNGGQITHRLLLKKTKVSTSQLNDALDTMVTSGTIAIKIVKNPHGRATEKIFLLKDDESIMSILSPDQGQYENRDGDIKSKKVKGDIIKGEDIVKPHTVTHIKDDIENTVHTVPDKTENCVFVDDEGVGGEPPLSQKGDSIQIDSEQAFSGNPKRGQYKTSEQRPHKIGDSRDSINAGVECKVPDDPEIARIKAGHQKHVAKKKRTCHICGYVSDHDLNPDMSSPDYVGCYICATCLITHQSKSKAQVEVPSPQTSLSDVVPTT
jgi:hypothetical protein